MNDKIIKLDPKEFGLETKQAVSIEQAFLPKIKERDGYISIYEAILKKEINKETCQEAGELRKKLVKVRTGIAAVHRSQKEYSLAYGRFCDAWKNQETLPVTQMEENLTAIEKHFERIEKERLEQIQSERVAELSKYVEDAAERSLSGMDSDVWNAYLSTKKKEYEDRIAAEKKAEEDRIAKEKAEEAERERIRKENEQLKKEAEERERLAKIEADKRAKAESERIAKETEERKKREEKERKEREQYEAKLKAEREERQRIEQEEKAKREKLEAELRAKAEQERKVKEEAEAAIQAELSKGDIDKVADLLNDLEGLKTKYTSKSAKNKNMYAGVSELLERTKGYIEANS